MSALGSFTERVMKNHVREALVQAEGGTAEDYAEAVAEKLNIVLPDLVSADHVLECTSIGSHISGDGKFDDVDGFVDSMNWRVLHEHVRRNRDWVRRYWSR